MNQPAKKTKVNDHNYRWSNVSPPVFDTSFGGKEFDVPPENFEVLIPLHYFQMFWNKDLNKRIAKQTNLYSVQMLMSLVDLPSYMMYWARKTRYLQITEVMPINRYKKLRQYLYFSDNSRIDDAENENNKLYKIQPVIDHVRNKI